MFIEKYEIIPLVEPFCKYHRSNFHDLVGKTLIFNEHFELDFTLFLSFFSLRLFRCALYDYYCMDNHLNVQDGKNIIERTSAWALTNLSVRDGAEQS